MRIELDYNEFANVKKGLDEANKTITNLESEIKQLKEENSILKDKLQEISTSQFFERIFHWKDLIKK